MTRSRDFRREEAKTIAAIDIARGNPHLRQKFDTKPASRFGSFKLGDVVRIRVTRSGLKSEFIFGEWISLPL